MAEINYKLIKNFFSKEELIIYQKYCHNKLDLNKDYTLDNQSFSPAWYDDPLMTAILDSKPFFSCLVSLKLLSDSLNSFSQKKHYCLHYYK